MLKGVDLLLRRILKKERYRVITVPDGETALHLTKEKEPDLILLDLACPPKRSPVVMLDWN